jgi:hypothetical protein
MVVAPAGIYEADIPEFDPDIASTLTLPDGWG